QADLAGSAGVSAAAQFRRKVSNPDHAHLVAIFLAKQRHGVILVDGHVYRYILDNLDSFVAQNFFVDDVFNILQFFVFDPSEVREIKAQMIRSDQRTGLLHMLAQHFSQTRVEQMRSRVIAHCGLARFRVDDGIDFIAGVEWGFHDNLMRAHSLYRVIASSHFGNDSVVVVGVKPSAIANLPTGFGVEGSVIENDLAGVAGLEFLHALAAFDDGKHFAVIGARLAVTLEIRFRESLVSGIGGLLGRTLPGGASTLALLGHGPVEAFSVKRYSEVTTRIFDEISRQPKGVVEFERLLAGKGYGYPGIAIQEVDTPRDCCCDFFLLSSTGHELGSEGAL